MFPLQVALPVDLPANTLPLRRAVSTRLRRGVAAQECRELHSDGLLSSELLVRRRASFVALSAALLPISFSSASAEEADAASSPTIVSEPRSDTEEPIDTSTWLRVRGDDFAIRVPPGFIDATPDAILENPSAGARQQGVQPAIATRFVSPDSREAVAVAIRLATQLKLTFFQVGDIRDFGDLSAAAPIFVPRGARLVASRSYVATPRRVARTFYEYEFVTAEALHVILAVAVAKGSVYAFGASAPEERWPTASDRMRAAANAFTLVI